MKKLLFILLLLPSIIFAQKYEDLDNVSKAKVDSIVNRMSMIRQMKKHKKMVSFIEWGVNSLDDFWSYLLFDLNYKTAQPDNSVNLTRTKTGYKANFFKISQGYQQKKENLSVAISCDEDGVNTKQVVITGPFNLLYELYLKYWEGSVRPDFTKSGAFEKTYIPTVETIWLYSDRILIKPFKEISSY